MGRPRVTIRASRVRGLRPVAPRTWTARVCRWPLIQRALCGPHWLERGRRGLQGGTLDHVQTIARAGQAKADVGVLGHVVGVPPADRAQGGDLEVVAGAAKRERQAPARIGGKQHLEEGGVLQSELLGDEGQVARRFHPQGRLQAGQISWLRREPRRRLAQLQRIGSILGVVDDNERSLGQFQGDIAGPGLGARLARRGDQHLDKGRQIQGVKRQTRRQIVGLEHDQRLQAVARIVQSNQVGDQFAGHLGFAVERRDQRVVRQVMVGQRRAGALAGRRQEGGQSNGGTGYEDAIEQPVDALQQVAGRQRSDRQKAAQHHDDSRSLPSSEGEVGAFRDLRGCVPDDESRGRQRLLGGDAPFFARHVAPRPVRSVLG